MRGENTRAFYRLGILLMALLAWPGVASAQKWDVMTTPVPFNVGVALQLTDGEILIQDRDHSYWWKLFPDEFGDYTKGSFFKTDAIPLTYSPLFFASAVLPDGQVIVEGGEYNHLVPSESESSKGAIFDPVTGVWTEVKPPTGWMHIGDAPSVVANFGGTWTFMLGHIYDEQFALLDESSLTWTVYPGTGKFDPNGEEGWTLLPGGDVLTVDTYLGVSDPTGKGSEIFTPSTATWTGAGGTGTQLWDSRNGCGLMGSHEVGPAVLRPNGTVFATGANTCPGKAGHTAIYNTKTKKWAKGPNFLNERDIADGPAAVLSDGNVLVDTNPGYGNCPSTLYEFDGTKFLKIPQPPGLNKYTSGHCTDSNTEGARMLVMPDGTVMLTYLGTPDIWFYHPRGTYKKGWQPHITSFPACVVFGGNYTVSGTQFNGLTQGAAFGDDAQSATNYPLVRIRNDATGHIFYSFTYDFSTMAVATGSKTVSTTVDVLSEETGASTMEVIANGIPSPPVKIMVEKSCPGT
jgi:hypothetical protein